MEVAILGCYAATPTTSHRPTSQVLSIGNHLFLIDCGEGTQTQLRRQKIKFSRIKHIFISHLHGDHFYGLIGLIATFGLLDRKTPLHIYGPKGIKVIITLQLKLSKSWTGFPLYFHELEQKTPEIIFQDDKVSVETIPLDHRVYTNGFLFKEALGDRKLLIDKVDEYQIDVAYYKSIKKGKDVPDNNGNLIANKLLTAPPPTPKSYAFCSDTAFKPTLAEQLKNVSVLYHEATFLERHKHLCEKTKHATAKQAATLAKMAAVKKLILGHYSTRYGSIEVFKQEAQQVFPKVLLAEDGKKFKFD